jgi:GT2 family glycosyltransferase/Flp pilus assembly protein TadD
MFRLFQRRLDPSARMVAEADALRDAGQYSDAAKAYARVLPLLPERVDLIVQYANMLKGSGDLEAAEAAYRTAIAAKPSIADTPFQLGNLLKMLGDRNGARAAYRQALTLDPSFTAAARELRYASDVAFLTLTLNRHNSIAAIRALSDESSSRARADASVPVDLWPVLRAAWEVPSPPPPPAQAAVNIALSHGAVDPAATHVLFCPDGIRLHPRAREWFTYAATIASNAAFFADGETVDGAGSPDRPIFRSYIDGAVFAPCATLGPVLLPARLANSVREAVEPAAALASMIHAKAFGGEIGHIPLPLAIEPTTVAKPSLPPIGGFTPKAFIHAVIPTRNNGADVEAFVDSLRSTAAAPHHLTITIIDNGSNDTMTAAALARIPQVCILRRDTPFNWSRLNNEGAEQANGAEILLFANDDMRMLRGGWDDALRRRLADPAVGAVGARLVYPDGTVQHAGILAGWQGRFIHDGLDAVAHEPGPGGRWLHAHAAAAVTGAFIAVRRDDFARLGGFDAASFAVSYGDVDFCYRLRELGLLVIYEPAIEALHYESKTRGRDDEDPVKQARDNAEFEAFAARWGGPLSDPSVNPFFVDIGRPFRLIAPPTLGAITAHIALTASPTPWKARRVQA